VSAWEKNPTIPEERQVMNLLNGQQQCDSVTSSCTTCCPSCDLWPSTLLHATYLHTW